MRAMKQMEKKPRAIPCQTSLILSAGHAFKMIFGKEDITNPIRHSIPAVFILKRKPKSNARGTSP